MGLRKPTLDEWFLAYQLRSLSRDGFFNPGELDVDITAIVERWRARGERLSYPALVIKALALTAQKVPEINRAYVKTPLGDRVAEFDHISVNMPVALKDDRGETVLSAMVVKHADQHSVTEIASQIRASQARTLDQTKITKIVARKPNTLLWRTVLKGIHFAAYSWPGMAKMGAGGLSVSSLLEHRADPPPFRTQSFGPTAITIMINNVREAPEGRHVLELGVGLNHVALGGLAYRRMSTVLHDLLATRDPELLKAFD